jgi:hypothetical protein
MQSIRTPIETQMTKLKNHFGQVKDLPLGGVLPTKGVAQAVEEEVGVHRRRVFPPLVTLTSFIGQVLDPDHSCREAVAQGVAERGAAGEAPCSSATGASTAAGRAAPALDARDRSSLGGGGRVEVARASGQTG